MSEKISYRKFHLIQRDVIAEGLPHYSFVDRDSQGGGYVSFYREKPTFLYVKDAEIFCLSPDENLIRIPLSSVRKLYLGTGTLDSEVTCSIQSRVGWQVIFGDHSYCRGVNNIAEVRRVEFRAFVEAIQRTLVEQGWDRKVTFEARGPSSRAVGCLTGLSLFGLPFALLVIWGMFCQESLSQVEAEVNSWIFAGGSILLCAVGISLALYLSRILSPRIRFEKDKTPDSMFDAANAAITSECQRYQSAQRFTNYSIPEAEKGVYQYTDAKGYHGRYQVTDREVIFRIWKDGDESREERYRLGSIARVNLNQPRTDHYTISITFYGGNTWCINTEDFNATVANHRAHAESQRARLRSWIDELHQQLIERKCSSHIVFTSGDSSSYKLTRVGMLAFNFLVFGTVIGLVLLILSGRGSISLLFEAFMLGLVGVGANVISSLMITKQPTQPYSPESPPRHHVPPEKMETMNHG